MDPHSESASEIANGAAQNNDERHSRKKKRLSRKEQKARKRQKKQQHKPQPDGPLARSTSSERDQRKNEKEKDNGESHYPNRDGDGASEKVTSPIQRHVLDDDPSYTPTPIPTIKDLEKQHGAKTLGKWFPKAVIIKSREPPLANSKASLLLFYQYVDPLWTESVIQHLMAYVCHIAEKYRILGGRFRVAREGVNATISSRDCSGSGKSKTTAAETLRHFARDLQSFDPVFEKTDFKFIDNLTGDRHFKDFKVFPIKELVYYGLDEEKAPLHKGGTHLDARDFHRKLEEKDTVVVDVRNHYEAAIGRFDGQQHHREAAATNDSTNEERRKGKTGSSNSDGSSDDRVDGGAVYVDPKMRKSTDFATWLQKPDTQSQLAGKQVLL